MPINYILYVRTYMYVHIHITGFLRSLFSVVSPSQVIRLIRSFFRASRRNKRVEESELRLQMVEEVGLFDHLVAVNFPYTVDAPLATFTFKLVAPTVSSPSVLYAISGFTPTGIRGAANPTPYLLAHTLINEIMVSYRQVHTNELFKHMHEHHVPYCGMQAT